MTRTMSDYIGELEQRRARALEMGGPDKIDRQRARGRLTARERIEGLVDAGSFIEFGLLAHSDLPEAEAKSPADGKVCGVARIDGRMIAVSATDVTVFAGAQGRVGLEQGPLARQACVRQGLSPGAARRGWRSPHPRHPRIRRHRFLFLVARHLSEPPAPRTDG